MMFDVFCSRDISNCKPVLRPKLWGSGCAPSALQGHPGVQARTRSTDAHP
jgi:hypothetical protein